MHLPLSTLYKTGWLICCFYLCSISLPLYAQQDYTGIPPEQNGFIIPGNGQADTSLMTVSDTAGTFIPLSNQAAAGSTTITRLLREGNAYLLQGKYQEALVPLYTALFLCRRKPGEQLAAVYNNLANVYIRTSDYNKALRYYLLAIRESEQLPELTEMHATMCSNLATLFIQTEDYERALYYLEKGEKMLRAQQHTGSYLDRLLLNKAIVLDHLNNSTATITTYKEALSLSRSNGDKEAECIILNNIGDFYLNKKIPRQAIPFLEEAKRLAPQQSSYIQVGNLISLGEAYTQMEAYGLAEHYLSEAFRKATESGMKKEIMVIHELLSSLYGVSGDYRHAWQHHRMYASIRDSLLKHRKMQDLNQIEVKYRTAEKDKELFRKELMITRQQHRLHEKNNWITGIAATSVLLTILAFSIYRNYHHKQRLQQERIRNLQQEQSILQQEKEIDRLKAIMQGAEQERARLARELHDGIVSQLSAIKMNFNALGNRHYNNTSGNSEFREALQQLDDATEELRSTSHNLMPQILLQSGLQPAIEAFCEKTGRSIPGLHIECLTYGFLPLLQNEHGLMIYRSIQELVQNAVKHAHASYILVQLNSLDNILDITVEDNGIGISDTKAGMPESLGLHNIRERVHLLHGKMHIETGANSGTSVYLEFNYNQWKTDSV